MNCEELGPELHLSCLPVSYFPAIIEGEMKVSAWIAEGEALGLAGVDVSQHFYTVADKRARIENTLEALERFSIPIILFNTYSDLTHPDRDVRKKETAKLLDGIATAAFLGAKWVRLVAGQAYPETEQEEGISLVLQGFEQAAEKADKEKVGLVFENHSKPGNWRYPDFSFDTDIFLSIAEASASLSVDILFDTANAVAAGVEPISLLGQVLPRTVCIHAADTVQPGVFEPCQIGDGAVPFTDIFRYLQEASFSGWISIEEASFQGKTGIQGAVDFIKKRWYLTGGNRETARSS